MSRLTTTIDDSSPLINYQPGGSWQQTVADAQHQKMYYDDTLTTTWDQTASASFLFNGTSITIYGSKGSDHGNYTVNIDGRTVYCTAFVDSSANASHVPIFTADNLHQVLHTVIVTNSGSGALDIDAITWDSELGGSSTTGVNTTLVDDVDSSFSYSPEGAWSMTPMGLERFNGTTGHTTSNQGASVRHTFTVSATSCCLPDFLIPPLGYLFRFPSSWRCNLIMAGNAISLFGSVGPQNSLYNVTLDDWPTQTLNATRSKFEPQTVLFYADNIGHGTHVLTLTNVGNKSMDIDYALVRQSVSSASHNPEVSNPSTPQNPFHLRTSGVIGLAVGIFVIVALLASLWLLSRKNKTLWTRLQRGYMVQSQFDASASNSVDSLGVAVSLAVPMHKSHAGDPPVTHNGGMSEPRRAPSQLSASSNSSTLVAEDGSNATGYPRRVKPIPGRPAWSFNTGRSNAGSHIRSSSTRNLLEESESLRSPEEDYNVLNTRRPLDPNRLNGSPVTYTSRRTS